MVCASCGGLAPCSGCNPSDNELVLESECAGMFEPLHNVEDSSYFPKIIAVWHCTKETIPPSF